MTNNYMAKIYDSSGNLITEAVSRFLPRQDYIKIKNRLLDGTYHIQTVGKAVKLIDIDCSVNEAGKEAIDSIDAACAPLKITRDGKYYVGLILDAPKWDIAFKGNINRRKYIAQFTLAVHEEGVDT